MNALLTPEQIDGIEEFAARLWEHDTSRARIEQLLRDREAIAEYLESEIAEFLRGINFARGLLGEKHENTDEAERKVRALVTAIRGEKE